MPRRICVSVLRWILCFALCATPAAFAQAGAANVAGIVEDSTGARIPDAHLKLINVLTGTENDSATSKDGVFLIPGVIAGTYTLQIERQGFSTAQVTGLNLNAGDTKNLLIRLRIGSVSETVEIDASGITLNTADATMGTTVDRKFVTNVPVNGRSFQDLITMTPGVLTQSPQAIASPLGANGGLNVNGQKTNTNNFFVDGVSGNFGAADLSGARKIPSDGSLPGLTAIGTTQSLASVDALEEFRVLASSYSAEYGTAPGGQFSLATRSGAETGEKCIHGSLYNYRRFNASDSIDWFESFLEFRDVFGLGYSDRIPYHQNDVGGTIELPIVIPHRPNRLPLFLFASFEEIHVHQPTPYLQQYVPTMQIRQSGPEALRLIWSDFPDPVFIPSEAYPYISPYAGFVSTPSDLRATGIRLDWKAPNGFSAFLRYADSPSNNQEANLSSVIATHTFTRTVTAGLIEQLTQGRNNDLRLGFSKSISQANTTLESIYAGFYPGASVPTDLLSDLGVPTSNTSARGQVYIHIPGTGESTIDVDQASSALRQWNPRDIFSLQTGHHFWRFGVDYRHIVSNVNPASLSVEADFFDDDSLSNNLASDISITRTRPATPVFNEFSAFVQDEWKVSKRFTLSPGLRWEVDPPPHGKGGADAYTLLGSLASPATLQLAPRGTQLWHTSWLNLAPRFGAAWSVDNKPGQETVLRAGAGVYFDTDNQPASEAFNAIGFSATNHLENVPVPVTQAQLDFTTTPSAPYINTTAFAFPRHLQLPYTLQWNVSIDTALGRNQTLNASWVGAGGRRLLQEQRINIGSQNPRFGEINYFPAGVSSNYQSLQLKFQRSITPGVQALASYVWAHTIDLGSTAPEFPLARGNSDLDVRQNLQTVISWQQHPRSGDWVFRHLLAGWSADGRLSVRTGFPVNLMGNLFSDPATGDRYYGGVDLVTGRPLYLHGTQFPGGRTFNGGPGAAVPAFELPLGTGEGDAPRNLVRDFGNFEINAGVGREFHFSNWLNLHLRGEAFNLLNHPSLGYIDPVLTNQLFGQATLLLNQSLGSSGPLYQPGGPRSIQFSARIHF